MSGDGGHTAEYGEETFVEHKGLPPRRTREAEYPKFVADWETIGVRKEATELRVANTVSTSATERRIMAFGLLLGERGVQSPTSFGPCSCK